MAQETWIKIVKNADSYRPVAGLSAWICQIARNTCLNGLRDLRWEDVVSEDAVENVAADVDLERMFNEAARSKGFETAFAALGVQQRTVLTMFIYEELSHAEIAVQLGISVGAVKQLVHRAKESLRERLKEWA